MKFLITIDGLSGSGKSTVGEEIAKFLNFEHISLGNLYRFVTYLYVENCNILDNVSTLQKLLRDFLKSKDTFYTEKLRSPLIENNLTVITQNCKVRDLIFELVKELAKYDNLIIDGRVAGTLMFPQADLKFFFFKNSFQKGLENKLNIKSKNIHLSNEDRLILTERDANDIQRNYAPLRIASEAITIYSFDYEIELLINRVYELIVKNVFKTIYFGKSFLNFSFKAIITKQYIDEPHILLVSNPTYSNIKSLSVSNCVVFYDDIKNYSHEVLLFKDYFIPFICIPNFNIEDFIGKQVYYYSLNGLGFITTLSDFSMDCKPFSIDCAFSSNLKGMTFCVTKGAEIVATRGEFMYFEASNKNPLLAIDNEKSRKEIINKITNTIQFGQNNFTHLIYRFTDFQDEFLLFFDPKPKFTPNNSSIGNRGTFRLLNSNLNLFLLEIEILSSLYNIKNNISVLLPYVRNINEAKRALEIIRVSFNGQVGCMIEVPAIVFRSIELDNIFDFFIIGVSDLLQLTQGSDRNEFEFHYDTYHFIADYIDNYFLSVISSTKTVYVTSEKLYHLLNKKYTNLQLLNKI